MQLGEFQIPTMGAPEAAFGAPATAYPPMDKVPEEYRRGKASGCNVFSSLFFKGGKLADHGLKLKAGVDAGEFYSTLRALMSSFAPPLEQKKAVCGWLIDTYTEAQ